jgi:predicted TIM-barrel fold metal-dependent hydrolase
MARDTAYLDFHLMQKVGIPRDRRAEAQGDVRLPAGTVVVSVDNHYSVSEDIWWEKFPAAMKDRAPRVVHQDGVYNIVVNGRSIIPEVSAPTLAAFEMVPGCAIMQARLADLDHEGIDKELIFGNAALALLFGQDLEARDIICRVYNEHMAEVGGRAPGRFHGVGFANFWDPARFEASLGEIKALGLKTFMVPQNPGKGADGEAINYASNEMEPFWHAVEASGLPLCIHIGENANPGRGGMGTSFMQNLAGFRKTIGTLIFGGVFDRHPSLRVVFMEGGINWVLTAIQDAELIWGSFDQMLDWKLNHPPRHYFDTNVYSAFMTDRLGLQLIDQIGADRVMWSADYPHPESTFGYSWTAMKQVVDAGVSDADVKKILGGNAIEVFKL